MTTEVKSTKFRAKCVGPGCKKGQCECVLVRIQPTKKKESTSELKTLSKDSIREQRRKYFSLIADLEKKQKEKKSIKSIESQLDRLIEKMGVVKPTKKDQAIEKSLKEMSEKLNKEKLSNVNIKKELDKKIKETVGNKETIKKLNKSQEKYNNELLKNEKALDTIRNQKNQKILDYDILKIKVDDISSDKTLTKRQLSSKTQTFKKNLNKLKTEITNLNEIEDNLIKDQIDIVEQADEAINAEKEKKKEISSTSSEIDDLDNMISGQGKLFSKPRIQPEEDLPELIYQTPVSRVSDDEINRMLIKIRAEKAEQIRNDMIDHLMDRMNMFTIYEDSQEDAESVGGSKNKPGEGMYSNQIEEAMEDVPNFKGVISADEIHTLEPSDQLSFIMNLDPSNKPGSHWVACMIDAVDDKSIMYFNSFGDPPSDMFMKDIKTLVDKINPPSMLKLKINSVPNQRNETDTCGYQSMNFIHKINDGMSFAEATGYKEVNQDNRVQGEGESKKLKQQLGFGYI